MNTNHPAFVFARGTTELRFASGDRAFHELELTRHGLTIRTMGAPKRTWTVPGLWAGWRAFERLSCSVTTGKALDEAHGTRRAALVRSAFLLGVRHAREGIACPPAHLTPEERREWRAGWFGFTSAPDEPIREKRWNPSPVKSGASSASNARKG